MAKTGKIHHPKDGVQLQNNQHFAASGTAQDVSRVLGILTDTVISHNYPGTTLLDPVNSASGQFWIIHFEIPMVANRLYTLGIFDRDDNTLLAKTAFLGAGGFGGISISYPQPGQQISCAEFAPYGTTTSQGGTMQGSLGCDAGAQFTQEKGPLNWVLYCVSAAIPGPCSLTVSQPGAMPAVAAAGPVNFTCART